MKQLRLLLSIFSLAFLSACGGGGGSGGDPTTTLVAGKVVDGYLVKSRVFVDFNQNLLWDEASEPGVLTDYQGAFSLQVAPDQLNDNTLIVAQGGFDIDTDLDFTGILTVKWANRSANGQLVISPLNAAYTSLADVLASDTDAATAMSTLFGISSDMLVEDPVALFGTQPSLYQNNVLIARLVSYFADAQSREFAPTLDEVMYQLSQLNTSIDAVSQLSVFGMSTDISSIIDLYQQALASSTPQDPETKYTEFTVPNLLTELTETEYNNLPLTPQGIYSGDQHNTLHTNYYFYNSLPSDTVGLTYEVNGEQMPIDAVPTAERYVFFKLVDGASTTRYAFYGNTTTFTNNIVKYVSDGVTESWQTLNTVTSLPGRYIWQIRSAVQLNQQFVLLGVLTLNSQFLDVQSQMVVFDLSTETAKPVYNTSGSPSTMLPYLFYNDTIIGDQSLDVYNKTRSVAGYSYQIANNTVELVAKTEDLGNGTDDMNNTIWLFDVDRDLTPEVIYGVPIGGSSYAFYCSYEGSPFKACFGDGTKAFYPTGDNQFMGLCQEVGGTYGDLSLCRNTFANDVYVQESKQLTIGNAVLVVMSNSQIDFDQQLLKYRTFDSRFYALSNYNFDTYVEQEEYLPNEGTASSCSTSYPGDLSNEPQLVGQCQMAYFYACNKVVYVSQYPEKVPEFDLRIGTYCDILDGYKDFTDDGSNPKTQCSACTGF